MPERSLAGVEELIGLVDRIMPEQYQLVRCQHCAEGQHSDCMGRKSKLLVNGLEILGPCECDDVAHRLQAKLARKKGNEDGSEDQHA